jgi:hypothetical protein
MESPGQKSPGRSNISIPRLFLGNAKFVIDQRYAYDDEDHNNVIANGLPTAEETP